MHSRQSLVYSSPLGMDFVRELRDEYTTDEEISAMKAAIDGAKARKKTPTGFAHPSWTTAQLAEISQTHNILYNNMDWHEYIEMTRTLLMEGATPTGPFEERLAIAKALCSFDPATMPSIYAELERLASISPSIGDIYTAMAAVRMRIFQPDLALTLLDLAASCPDYLPSLHLLVLSKAQWMRKSCTCGRNQPVFSPVPNRDRDSDLF